MNRFDLIRREVSRSFHVSVDAMRSPSRAAHVARPRQVAMYLARERYGFSWQQCAALVNRDDHTTAIHAAKSTARRMAQFPAFARQVEAIEERLG